LIERVPKDVADARRYDESSPVEKVDIDIGRLQQRTMALKRLGAGKQEFAELAEEMAKLHRRKRGAATPKVGAPRDDFEPPVRAGQAVFLPLGRAPT
jgi:hypothetical protein